MASEQPEIANVLGVSYAEPVSDAQAWSRMFGDPALAPSAPRTEAFQGPLGVMTRLIAPHVPWDPMAFLGQTLVALGNLLGYRFFIAEEATRRRPNLYLAVVGGTGSGKGTSYRWTEWVMRGIDERYLRERVTTAVGSGEGLLAKITDPVYGTNARGEEAEVIAGSDDKRVLYLEEELGQLFMKMISQDSVEKMVTKAWDSGQLETTTKKESMVCATPHVSIIGHITPDELFTRLDHRLIDNGFSNRWLYLLIKPTQVKFTSTAPEEVAGLAALREQLGANLRRFRSDGADEFVLTPEADDVYLETARFLYDHPQTGAMLKQDVRWRPLMWKLAVIYAAADGTNKISAEHFLAARAFWAYCSRSARAFFGSKSGNELVDRFMFMWRQTGYEPLTLSDIADMFSKNLNAYRRNVMLDILKRDGIIRIEPGTSAKGRPPTHVLYDAHARPEHPTTDW